MWKYSVFYEKNPTYILMNENKIANNDDDIDQRIKINESFYEGFGINIWIWKIFTIFVMIYKFGIRPSKN